MKIISFDPGESTGIITYDSLENKYEGICIHKDFIALEELIISFEPELLIIEIFQLYPGKARSLAWNTFYPCEVIGVLNFLAVKYGIKVVLQPASIKPYSKIDDFCPKGNNHVKDAYLHLWYYQHMKKKKVSD